MRGEESHGEGGAMTEKLDKLFAIFKQAVEDERSAQKTYEEALSLCEDPETEKVLKMLLQDEVRHEAHLVEIYNKIRKELD
jgi:rubrerythrin